MTNNKNMLFPRADLPIVKDDDEDTDYVDVINSKFHNNKMMVMRNMDAADYIKAKNTSCFGELYHDGTGFCDIPCLIKSSCKEVYDTTINPAIKPLINNIIAALNIPSLSAVIKINVKDNVIINGGRRRTASNYENKGRPVDAFVEEFVNQIMLLNMMIRLPPNCRVKSFLEKYSKPNCLYSAFTNTYFSIYDSKYTLLFRVYFKGFNNQIVINPALIDKQGLINAGLNRSFRTKSASNVPPVASNVGEFIHFTVPSYLLVATSYSQRYVDANSKPMKTIREAILNYVK